MAVDNYEALFGERLPHPMTLRKKETKEVASFPNFFPPSVWMVGADSDSVDLNEVFEDYFDTLLKEMKKKSSKIYLV